MTYPCEELEQAGERSAGVTPGSEGCAECLAAGDEWVHLRLCLACGHVGCCDSSKNKHATRHFRGTHHPVIRSFEPNEAWAYCYAHDTMVDELPARREEESAPVHYAAP